MKFRKKPIVIEAHQWHKNGDHPEDQSYEVISDPLTGEPYTRIEGKIVGYYRSPPLNDHGEVDPDGTLNGQKRHCDLPYTNRPDCTSIMHDHGFMNTIEGGHTVCPGDWVITGVHGEKYPCEPSVFEETYEEADDDT